MRYFIILLLVINFLQAKEQNVEVTAKHFEADETKLISKFNGNVKVVKGSDVITAENLTINFDKKKNPLKYTAFGHATFKLTLNKKHYKGKADKIIYDPVKKFYRFIGNAFLQESDSGKKVYGDDIKIDQLNGKYDVSSSSDKPVKFIFKVKK